MLRDLEWEEEEFLFKLSAKLTEDEFNRIMELYNMYNYALGYIEATKALNKTKEIT